MANYSFELLKSEYAELWHNMEIKPERLTIITQTADRIIANKDKYESLQTQTGVPWYFIGLLHLRESNLNFNTHLHNGDPLSARTVHVPAGKPLGGTAPFSFEYSAIDALKQKGYDKVTDWGIERIAYAQEKFNGFGYRGKGVNSPYLWAGTNNYTKGKYIRDHVFNANVVDTQLGVMPVLKIILEKTGGSTVVVPTEDKTISPVAEVTTPTNKEMRQVSRKFSIVEWFKWVFGLGGATTGAVKTLDASNIVATKTYVDAIKSFSSDYGVFIVIFICFAAFVASMIIMRYSKDDIKEGRYTPSKEKEQI